MTIMEMENQLVQMGKRLRELRTILEISPAEMARVTEMTEEEYLKHEAGTVDSSFTFIYQCAERFGVDTSALVRGDSPKLSYYNLQRKGTGTPIRRRHCFDYLHLAAMLKNRHADPFMVKAPCGPEDADILLTTHSGQEFDYIIKGRLKVQLDDKIEILEAGDTLYYDSSRPHGMIAIGDCDCEFLAVVIHSDGEEPMVVSPHSEVVVHTPKQDLIYHKFMSEELDERGCLKSVKFHYPENFNFAYDVVDALAEKNPAKVALVYVDKHHNTKKFTFADISKYSSMAANYLVSLGIRKGDRVMLVLKRHYQFWFLLNALHKIGAQAVLAPCQLQAKDYEYRFQQAEIKAVVHTSDGGVPQAIADAAKTCPTVKIRITVGAPIAGERDFNTEVERYSSVFKRPDDLKATDFSIMFFSSGTTGYPKMVEHIHTYPLGHIINARWWHNADPDGLHMTISDTGWAKALWGKIYGEWLCETAVFVYDFDRFDAADILPLIREHNVTTFCAPPTMYRFFIREDLAKYDLSCIKYSSTAGEALNPEVFNIWKKATGLNIMEGFGQTETTPLLANLVGMTPKPGSMGKPTPMYDVVLVDPDDNPVETGEVGEIAVRAKQGQIPGLFVRYGKNEEQTAYSWRNGLYHTGDTAWKDEDGYYWYVGRIDDLIKSSGYRIGPFEVESVLMELPYVLECAVVGVPDPIRGQLVKAFIVLTKGKEGTPELKKEIQDYVKVHTAPYKYPRKIEFMTALPKTVSGKIKRTDLRKMAD